MARKEVKYYCDHCSCDAPTEQEANLCCLVDVPHEMSDCKVRAYKLNKKQTEQGLTDGFGLEFSYLLTMELAGTSVVLKMTEDVLSDDTIDLKVIGAPPWLRTYIEEDIPHFIEKLEAIIIESYKIFPEFEFAHNVVSEQKKVQT